MAGYNTLSKEQLNEELVKLKEEYAKILDSDISLCGAGAEAGYVQRQAFYRTAESFHGNDECS